jgi:hypothetical protein
MNEFERLLGRAVFRLWPDLPRDMQERMFESASSDPDMRRRLLSCFTINTRRRRSRRHPVH